LSRQTFGILPRIRAVDALLRSNRALRSRVFEVHPELCFYFWNGGHPMRHAKHSSAGLRERCRLVAGVFDRAPARIRASIPRAQAADDDILDCLAALWTARRIHAGTAVRLPSDPQRIERDACGLPMQMLA
jgi:predicted RNase H-like nuclease